MTAIHFRSLFAAAILTCAGAVIAGEFVHPGVSHTMESIEFVTTKIDAGESPWAEAWTEMRTGRRASLDYQPEPRAHVERGPYNRPNIGSSEFSNDADAAYLHALQWALSGNEAHAEKSAEILDAWSGTLESISNHDARLLVGMEGYKFCNAAELLRHTWDGWPEQNQKRFEQMLREIFYPIIQDFYPSANGNWDASMIQSMLAMGVFLDDQAMFDRAKDYYLNGKGNGAIGNYFKPSGECQESGRDQAHTQMGLDFLACAAEIAWNQGVNLYGALDNRLLKGFEYTAKYNLGFDVPYEPYRSHKGRYFYKEISDDSRGRLRPMYEKVLNHYKNRMELEAPYTEQAVMKLRESSDERRSRRRRSSPLGTLMFSGQPRRFGSANTPSSAKATEDRPNILFIFADDWGWGDLSCHGHPYVKTPNIDRLAREGTDFHRFTVASGVCSPSRTAVMTGHFPARYNIDGHFAWVPSNAKRNMPDWLDPKAPLLPRFLQQAGYATAHYGKWHLANNMIPDSPAPGVYGYDEYGAFNCSGEQMPVHEDAMHTVAFIEKAVEANKPFFVNLWLHEPHTPFHTVPKFEWHFRHLENEADRIYASVLSHADDRVGEVLNALDRLGVTEDTLVIFSSDNGPARAAGSAELKLIYDTATGAGWGIGAAKGITGGRRGYKASLFEGGVGVPFIARWPGKIASGRVDEHSLISAVDLLPTFCEIAHVNLPEGYTPDGVSQVETLMGKVVPGREKPLYWKYPSRWPAPKNRPDHWVSYAVVQQNWKLVSNTDGNHVELYDIAASPYENNDLAASKPDVVAALLKQLEEWKATLPEKPTGNVFSKERDDVEKSKSQP